MRVTSFLFLDFIFYFCENKKYLLNRNPFIGVAYKGGL